MIRFCLLLISLTLLSCNKSQPTYNRDHQADFDTILNAQNMSGVILIYDPQTQTYYSNDFELAKKSILPASTFKIPNTIIALETQVMQSDTTMILWDGQQRAFDIWEKDMTLREAFQASCVPCYQEIARKIGVKNMTAYLSKLGFGDMDVTDQNIDLFWLTGKSNISPMEQISFLERFLTKKLPILDRTRELMLKIFKVEETNDYIFSGKSGLSDSNNGWYVGYLQKGSQTYYFALNANPVDTTKMETFVPGRKEAIYSALKTLQIL
nr:classD [uncultured bacterium]AMP50792.1 classD [uncultured bacterium]